MNSTKPKAKVYIDGANIFYTQKKLGWNLDWVKIKDLINKDKDTVEWRYYVGIKEDDIKFPSYLRYLDAIKINTITKPLKKIKIADNELLFPIYKTKHIYKANFDVEITTDILLDKTNIYDIVIFSGDSDFTYLIKRLKGIGITVTIYASKKTISWELKMEASNVHYLEDLRDLIEKK